MEYNEHCACSYCEAAQAMCEVVSDKENYQLKHKVQILQVVIKQNTVMQYNLLMMVLAEYSSSYSLFACHITLATSSLTLLKLSNFSYFTRSPHNVLHSPDS